MDIQVNIPENIFNLPDSDVSREVLETIAAEGFRSNQLSTAQVRRLLGLRTRFEVHEFLANRGIPWVDYSMEEVERELETWRLLFNK